MRKFNIIKAALNICKKIIKQPYGQLVIIHGPSGSGKTSILKLLNQEVSSSNYLLFCTCENLVEGYIEAIKSERLTELYTSVKAKNIILIDDTQYIFGKPATQKEIAKLLSAAIKNGAMVFLTVDNLMYLKSLIEEIPFDEKIIDLSPRN